MADVKIKTIPRSNDKAKPAPVPAPPVVANDAQLWARFFIGLSGLVFVLGALGVWLSPRPADRSLTKNPSSPMTQADRVAAAINRHTYNTHLMEQMMKRKVQMEQQAMNLKKSANQENLLPEDNRNYGVQMDQEDTAERLFEDLNTNRATYGDRLEEKVNSHIANRKWLDEMERAERVAFVKNFIRQAYERGYEVQLDQNLVVVGVRKIHSRSLSIDQVLDRIAKQGY